MSRVTGRLAALVVGHNHHRLTLRLTLILCLFYGTSSPTLQVPVRLLCTLMLVAPAFLKERVAWWALGGCLVLGCIANWYSFDNHKYLIAYWVLAAALSLTGPGGNDQLRYSARALTGLVFLLATLWKLIGGGYLDGSFFTFTFLTDGRLRPLAASLLGSPLEDVNGFSDTIGFLGSRGLHDVAIIAPSSASLLFVARALSWSGVVLEGSVGVAHILPGDRAYKIRHYLLMLFIAGTYFLLPVAGFAFVLAVLGFAQCDRSDDLMRLRYLMLFAFIHLTLLPWRRILYSWQ